MLPRVASRHVANSCRASIAPNAAVRSVPTAARPPSIGQRPYARAHRRRRTRLPWQTRDLEAELGWIAAEAGRHPARIRRVFLIKGCQGHSGNFEWEHARPAQVSDRVRELALAGNRLGLPDAKHQHDQQELKDGFHRHATGCRPG